MAAGRCSPPKGVAVISYFRSKPRKKRKAPAVYWECFKGSRGCGVHHGSQGAAYNHAIKLDRAERRRGRKGDWQPRKVTK